MNRSTTEIPKDMFKSLKTISLSLAALLLGAGSACGQQSDSYAHKVNTLIGTRGVGLTSGYLYPGATRSAWYSSRRPISPSGAGSSSTS